MTKLTIPSGTTKILFSHTSAPGIFVYEPIIAPGKYGIKPRYKSYQIKVRRINSLRVLSSNHDVQKYILHTSWFCNDWRKSIKIKVSVPQQDTGVF